MGTIAMRKSVVRFITFAVLGTAILPHLSESGEAWFRSKPEDLLHLCLRTVRYSVTHKDLDLETVTVREFQQFERGDCGQS